MTKSQSATLIRVFGVSMILLALGVLMVIWDGQRSSNYRDESRTPSSKDASTRSVVAPSTLTNYSKTSTPNNTSYPRPSQQQQTQTRQSNPWLRTPSSQGTITRDSNDVRRGNEPLVVNPTPRQDSAPPTSTRTGSSRIPPDFCKTPTFPQAQKKKDFGDRVENIAGDAIKEGLKRLLR